MNSNIIVELRQQDAIVVNANGDYQCQMSKDITIEAGDVVQLSKAFIDTVKEGNINIVDDLTLTIQNGVYITDWRQLSGNYIGVQGESIPCNINSPSFSRFIPYLGVDAGGLTGYTNYTGFQYKVNYGGDNEPPFTITYSYLDYMDRPQSLHTTFPGFTRKVNETYTDVFNIVAKTNSLKLVSPDPSYFSTYYGTTIIGPIGSAITTKTYSPFVFTTNIILPKGVYSPNQISTYISEQLSQANQSGLPTQNMSNSKFLFAITDFDNGRDNPDGAVNPTTGVPIPLTEQTKFISDDGLLSFVFPTNTPNFIGTSQIALEYDETADKFNWTYLHQPMFDATTGTNISVRFLRRGFQDLGDVVGIAENGGIYFNSLTAKNSRGVAVDFWSGLLGFDLDKLCIGTYSTISNKYGLTGNILLSQPLFNSVNTTTGYFGLDAGVIRGPNWYQRQSVPSSTAPSTVDLAQSGINSTINTTQAIYASQTLDVLLNKFSHYVLQTDLGFINNNFIGSQFYRNINGIISKYYAYGSYALAESDAAIQYIHSGAPIQLKSVHIRLLKSDKKLDINLGDDNTIILQIIKGGQGLPPVATPKKA